MDWVNISVKAREYYALLLSAVLFCRWYRACLLITLAYTTHLWFLLSVIAILPITAGGEAVWKLWNEKLLTLFGWNHAKSSNGKRSMPLLLGANRGGRWLFYWWSGVYRGLQCLLQTDRVFSPCVRRWNHQYWRSFWRWLILITSESPINRV